MTRFAHVKSDNKKTALVEKDVAISYGELESLIDQLVAGLLSSCETQDRSSSNDLEEERIAFVIPASLNYVAMLHGIWRAGGIAIPLNPSSATTEFEHYLSSAGVTRVIVDQSPPPPLQQLCEQLDIPMLTVEQLCGDQRRRKDGPDKEVPDHRRAMILFTSGTTSKPKGVVFTHGTIRAQIVSLVTAWEWHDTDVIPLFLPLHHVHGIINILSCALWTGATVHLFPTLDVATLCQDISTDTYSVLMAVPTVYVKLIEHINELTPESAHLLCAAFGRMRLNVSGSAACPVNVFEQWQALTGQVLLERYGMTEVGMAISNPYRGERRAGYIGQALPGVTFQLFDEHDMPVTSEATPGEIRMKGDNVFSEYWNNTAATRNSFKDGWFCSGDIAVVESGYVRIMGRASIDIIKSGGYKLSALEIEGMLLTHEAIREVAVIGLADDTWGEIVVAVASLHRKATLELSDLRQWCKGKMSSYKIPKRLELFESLPRNVMGKVTKPALAKQLSNKEST